MKTNELRRTQAQETNNETLHRLQEIASRVPGMVYQFLLRPDGSSCVPYTSEAIRDIYRVSPEQVQDDATAMFAVHCPEDADAVLASIQESARNLTPWQHEYRVKFDDGTVRWLFGNALPERLSDGSVLWHGFITDITKRRVADEKLRQLSRAAEQAPMAIVITDLQGNIEYINPSFTQVTGYTAQEILGLNPRILQSGLNAPAVFVDLWQTLLAGGVWHGELHNRKKNGQLFIESAVIAPVLNAAGHATHYVALKQDITQRKQDAQDMQDLLHEKVVLLNEVHHRVKNNLQIISSLLHLEAERSSQPDTKTVLTDMQGRIRSMALLHESLYREGTFASVDLSVYLKQLAIQVFRVHMRSDNSVQLQFDLSSVQVGMDQAMPCGLLVNELLSNALKHGFPGGRSGVITLQSQPATQAGFWRVSVQDNGVGLPEIFALQPKQSLGLQLVTDLTRQLGGVMDAAPAAGGGAAFSVIFELK